MGNLIRACGSCVFSVWEWTASVPFGPFGLIGVWRHLKPRLFSEVHSGRRRGKEHSLNKS